MFNTFFSRGGAWVIGQMILIVLAITAGIVWPGGHHPVSLRIVGWVLLIVAAALGLAGAKALGSSLTALPHPGARRRLVCTGVYGLVRHPLYVSVVGAAMGWACLRASIPAAAAAVALAVLLDAKARREEAWLREAFPEYQDYARRVRRFLPGIY